MGYIYMLKNKINGKVYIGQTIRAVEERFKKHQRNSNNCSAIYNAIQYHGWENFEKDWYECPDEDLNCDEELLVREMGTMAPSGYNLREGGGSNGKMSEESKQKISEATRGDKAYWYGKKTSEEHKQKLSDARRGEKHYMFGKKHTEETKQKQSEVKRGEKNPNYGKTHSGETKQKMSEAHLGDKNRKSKRVYQYNLDGTFINSFGSCEEAGRYFKKNNGTNISICAGDKTGRHKTAYGFKWSYSLNVIQNV
jgi:group I intron endonuclease